MTQPIQEMSSIFYTVSETCRLFGISSSTLNRWTESGMLLEKYGIHVVRGDNGHHYYLKQDVDRVWRDLVDTAMDETERIRKERGSMVHTAEASS